MDAIDDDDDRRPAPSMFGSESLLNIDLDALPVRAGIEPRRAGEGTGALSELRLPRLPDFVRMAAGRAGDEQA